MFEELITVVSGPRLNWVDLLVVLVVLYSGLKGLQTGFVQQAVSFAGFIVAFGLALKFYSFGGYFLTGHFGWPRGVANAAGFLLIGLLGQGMFTGLIVLTGKFLLDLVKPDWNEKKVLRTIDMLLGTIPAVGSGLLILVFFLTLLVVLPTRGRVKAEILESRLGGFLVRKTQGMEQGFAEIFGEAIEDSLTFLTIQPDSRGKVDLGFEQWDVAIDESSEREMWVLINQERKERGLKELSFEREKTREAARGHAKDMFEKGYFSHINTQGQSPFDRLEKAGVVFAAAGENLALAPNVGLAHQGLMASRAHRENILSPEFSQVGVGVMDGGVYGKMFVQLFTD